MDFQTVFRIISDEFSRHKIDFAVIGGFALSVAGYQRATEDIDLLIARRDLSAVKKIMSSVGFELLYESKDVATFLGKMKELGRVDFLLAHRKYATDMLNRANTQRILSGEISVRVITPEDLIGLKVQSSSNDSSRYSQDIADIEAILRNNKKLDFALIRDYFILFDRGKECEDLLKKIKNAH